MSELSDAINRYAKSGGTDEDASTLICNQFWSQARAVAARQLSPVLQQRVSPTSAVQGGMLDTLLVTKRNRLTENTSTHFLRVLKQAVHNRCASAARRHSAGKRAISRSVPSDFNIIGAAGIDPSVELQFKELADEFGAFLATNCNDSRNQQQDILRLVIHGLSAGEIHADLKTLHDKPLAIRTIRSQIRLIKQSVIEFLEKESNKHDD